MSSHDDMSTRAQPDSADITPDTSLTEMAERIARDTDDPLVGELATVVQVLAGRRNDTDDYLRQYVEPRVQDLEDNQAEAAAERAGHTERLAELDQQLASFLGPVGNRSPREKRMADIRTGMIRAAEAVGPGVRKHRYDIIEMLAEHGYDPERDIPSKPQLREDMKELAGPNEEARYDVKKPNRGIVLDTKEHKGDDGRIRDVLAVRVETAELPSQAASNQVTTHETGGGG